MSKPDRRRYPVKRIDVSINMEKTGKHIKQLLTESGYTMSEIMEITGVTTEQAIYKWYSGKSIPSLETQIILCRLLGLHITELLVIDEEFHFTWIYSAIIKKQGELKNDIYIRRLSAGTSSHLF